MAVENLITEHIDIWTSAEKTRSTSGRGSSKKLELYGVKKLRELILELAVRGKLVPQDPNDEPASVLLERIAAEKTQLVKEKKIKKQKALPEVTEQEAPFNVPKGWEWTRLGNLSSDIHYGYTASAKPNSEGVRLLRITDIQNDKVNWGTVPACDITEEKAKSYLLENDDILIARTGGTIGKSYLVENIDLQAVFASYLIRVKRVQAVYAPFTKVFLGSQLYWKQLIENSAGTGQPNVNATALKQLLFIVPPFNQQKRIVAKVDELMALCDQLEQQTEASIEAHQVLVTTLLDTLTNSADADELMQNWTRISEHFDTLFTTEESIDQLKQTILQLAVMGKLVSQDPNDEPASELLKRIAEEKAQLVKEKKIKKQKALPPIAEDEKPFELPTGWEWCRLGEVINLVSGQHLKPSEYTENSEANSVPYITGPAEFGSIYPTYSKYTLEKRALAQAGHILITCKGAGLGKLNRAKQTMAISRQLMAIEPVFLDSDFLYNVLDCQYNYFQSKGVGIAIPGISRDDVTHMGVSLPPLNEQKRILVKLSELMNVCDLLKSRLIKSKNLQLHLTDAIVSRTV
ncbi:restriction endonuclease subunit S [Vibrio fluvialis]|uniref:restriction endonuclease subunit S n=2 Tax=Vibrio parahaemolyticus TaxID=670 RepID=UPI001123E38C|nr:restriction endonuclease subunit S [Vibrio parahaemolyticus]EMC0406463.1 restriction endonuclease subunit S [Vibrio fluvialis]TON03318.1 restriction endonuclease subunit S [Vibrio parahaemolyticus]